MNLVLWLLYIAILWYKKPPLYQGFNLPIFQLKISTTKHKKIYQISGIWYINIPNDNSGFYARKNQNYSPLASMLESLKSLQMLESSHSLE